MSKKVLLWSVMSLLSDAPQDGKDLLYDLGFLGDLRIESQS